MKVIIHKQRCVGHAVCSLAAPEVYKLNDDGYNVMDPFEVPRGLEEKARKGAQACPELAIEIVD